MTGKIAGYGRYRDDPTHVGCPRARTDMTPCIARDGAAALDDPAAQNPTCVGCVEEPRTLLVELSEVYEPARRYLQTKTRKSIADTLTRLVREATEPMASPK